MVLAKFEKWSNLLGKSNCPEDFFGPIGGSESGAEKVTSIYKEAEAVANFDTAKNANASYRVTAYKHKLEKFYDWAAHKLADGTYGDMLPYRTKLTIAIKDFEDERFFYIESDSNKIYFQNLSAISFEGYDHSDKVRIIKNGIVTTNGNVREYGTHAARELFFFDNMEKQGELTPNQFDLDNVIEIETQKYTETDDFIHQNYRFHKRILMVLRESD